MKPFDTIEKWINEHGSAAILRDRIELVKEEHTKLEGKVIELTKELDRSRGEIERLEKQNRQLNWVIQIQQETIKGYESEPDRPDFFGSAGDSFV
jgi:hypothetical protein